MAMPPVVGSIISFGRAIMPEMFTAKTPPMHYAIEEALLDPFKENVSIVAPRASGKSSVGVELNALHHLFCYDRYLYEMGHAESGDLTPRYVVIISKTQREAKARLNTIKRVLGHDGSYSSNFRKVFGNWGEDTASVWQEDFIQLKNGSAVRAIGMRQPGRGMKAGTQRPTLSIVDDGEDEENTRTPEALEKNLRWLEQVVVPAMSRTGFSKVVVIGTPINTDCMVVKLFETPGWHSMWFKNQPDQKRSMWWSEAENQWHYYKDVLWPDIEPAERLIDRKEKLEAMGLLSSFYREYCCEIVGDEDQIFLPEYEMYYEGELRFDEAEQPYMRITKRSSRGSQTLKELEKPQEFPVSVVMAVDPAASQNIRADKTAIAAIAIDKFDNLYVLPYVHERLMPHQIIEKIVGQEKVYKPARLVVETSAAFGFVTDYLWKDHRIRAMTDKPTQAKKGEGSRLEAMQPLMKQGRIWMMKDMSDLAEQFRMYPRGKDDLIDALEKAIRYRIKPRHSEIVYNYVGFDINADPYDRKSGYNKSKHGSYNAGKKGFDPMLA